MPRELIPLVGMLMSGTIMLALVAGFFVTRLARLRVQAAQQRSPDQDKEIARLEAELLQTRDEVRHLAERQQFIEQLLEKRPDPAALPR